MKRLLEFRDNIKSVLEKSVGFLWAGRILEFKIYVI